jgi:hypothetical protein
MPRKRRIGGGRTQKRITIKQIRGAEPLIKKAEHERNGVIKASRTYKAWEKAIELVEDIHDEYKLLKAGANQKPLEIAECKKRLMKAIKVVLPYVIIKLSLKKLAKR